MFTHDRNIVAAMLALTLVIPYLSLPVAVVAQNSTDHQAQRIENRDRRENGITVGEPRVYDDAQLQQRLQELEARLATLQLVDQKAITDKLGAVTGASQRISSFAFNVQAAPVPGVTTTTKLPTEQTTTTTAAGATSSGINTVSNLATEDVQTTRPQFSPPPATAPAPTTNMPSTFSVSSSDILDEMMQVTAEINGLRLLLSGDLSSHYIRGGQTLGNQMTKLKTTLGFNISVKPDGVEPEERYKDAVAVVEVEIENVCETISDEPPAITALLPREKTYNVAEITDRSTSIGGGVATQILGVSGSWFRGHKTHYLVRDQDTVALTFTPEEQPTDTCKIQGGANVRPKKRVGFVWQFRPVLGRRYARIAEKTTFVQLAFPVRSEATDNGIGKVTVRTYWRGYDRKRGVHKEVIPDTVREQFVDFDIPRYKLAVSPSVFNFRDSVEDLGGGQILVKLPGRFLAGTNVRIGPTILAEGERFKHRYSGIRFVATASELATKKVFLVAHDGSEVPLELGAPVISRADPKGSVGRDTPGVGREIQVPVCGETLEREPDADGEERHDGRVVKIHTTEFEVDGSPRVTTIDETNSRLSLTFVIKRTTHDAKTGGKLDESRIVPNDRDKIPGLVLTVGPRSFGYSDGPLARRNNVVTAVVPSALLATTPEITLQLLLPQQQCRTSVSLSAFDHPGQIERLALLEQGDKRVKFLLYGTRLTGLTVLAPAHTPKMVVTVTPVGSQSDDRLLQIEMDSGHLKTHKHLLVQRPGRGEQPFLIAIPPPEAPKKPDPPKAKERVTVGSDEAEIEGEGLKDVSKVFFEKRAFAPGDVEIADDGKSLRLSRLTALGVTATASSRPLVVEFKSGAKATVSLEVVNTKVETVTK